MLCEQDRRTARSTIFFRSLPPDVFDSIARFGKAQEYGKGEPIFRQGEPARAIFAVLDGVVKLSTWSAEGQETIVELMRKGTSFAEALAFRDDVYPVTATGLNDCRIFFVPNNAVKSAIEARPDVFGAILGATYAHLHRLVRQIEQLKTNSGLERVGQFILTILPTDRDPAQLELPFDKNVLAAYLGMQPETLSRIFRQLETHGVMIEGRTIRLNDRPLLEERMRQL